MGIIRRIIVRKAPADNVFSSCGRVAAVDCWTMPNHAGIRLAAFLQFHTTEGESLPADSARLRFAFRNFYPQLMEFRREIESVGGVIGSYPSTPLKIPASRERQFREELSPGAVPVTRGEDDTQINITFAFVNPPGLRHINDELRLMFDAARRHRCPCCLQSFPS